MSNLLQQLRQWRQEEAAKEGVELFRVLSNTALQEIAAKKPSTKDELLAIKGIKDAKYAKYGARILSMVRGEVQQKSGRDWEDLAASSQKKSEQPASPEPIFSVSEYIETLNIGLAHFYAKIKGEISSVDARGGHRYFSIQDKENKNVLRCIMWKGVYEMQGVELSEGMEVIVEGRPKVFEKNGMMSLHVDAVYPVGEGELAKAYRALKEKLEREGLFSEERKKTIPQFPQSIGLITSREGAVIDDFRTNLGRHGVTVYLMDTRVEGQRALPELRRALKYFSTQPIDVLVVIRGGGSLESLLPFNNETLVREIAEYPVPVIAGIGHDKDVTLFALASDRAVSTPTAVTMELNREWNTAGARIDLLAAKTISSYRYLLSEARARHHNAQEALSRVFSDILELFRRRRTDIVRLRGIIALALDSKQKSISRAAGAIHRSGMRMIKQVKAQIESTEQIVLLHDPLKPLRLGYSIATNKEGKVIRSTGDVDTGEHIDIKVGDGIIEAEAKGSKINNR